MKFPEVFTDDSFEYVIGEENTACADGLTGWANCVRGGNPPEFFGVGMVKIAILLGVSSTPESLEKYADSAIGKKRAKINTAK